MDKSYRAATKFRRLILTLTMSYVSAHSFVMHRAMQPSKIPSKPSMMS